jgi:hypothetical protein
LVRNIPSLNNPQSRTAVLVRRYLKLVVTFMVSGLIHAGGSLYMSRKDSRLTDGGNLIGFFYQALMLVGEDLVLWILGIDPNAPPTLLRRVIGYTLIHSYAAYATPTLKVIPLAQDAGIQAAGHPLMIGVKMAGQGARGVLGNPFATTIGIFNI